MGCHEEEGIYFKWSGEKSNPGKFNLEFHDDILKQSFAKSSVQYVFLSLLLQGWARQRDQNDMINTLPQQLTTMPMIRSNAWILLESKTEISGSLVSITAGLNKYWMS